MINLKTLISPYDIYLIAGPTGAGKTALSQQIKNRFGGSVLLLDNYFKNEEEVEIALKKPLVRFWDSPKSLDWDTLLVNLEQLLQHTFTKVPIFSFKNNENKRIGYKQVKVKFPFIIEGLYALDEQIINHLEKNNLSICKIFANASPATRFERIKRRQKSKCNIEPDVAFMKTSFDKVIRKAEKTWINKQKNIADLIVTSKGLAANKIYRYLLDKTTDKKVHHHLKFLEQPLLDYQIGV